MHFSGTHEDFNDMQSTRYLVTRTAFDATLDIMQKGLKPEILFETPLKIALI